MCIRLSGKSTRRGNGGQTLIEVIIASALGIVVVVAAVSLYRGQRQSFALSADAAGMRDAGTAALLLISRHIEMAGYIPPDKPSFADFVEPAVFGCTSAIPIGHQAAWVCIPDANDSDGLIVRYADDAVATWPTRAGEAGEYGVISNRFFVRTPHGGDTPQLYCEGSGAASNKQPIVAGVERLKLRYWIKGATVPADASSIPSTDWSNVVAIDLCVQVRGNQPMQATQYLDCEGVVRRGHDGRARQVFMRRIAIRNHASSPI
jgi:type IV pilus assembly protein PilW